MNKTPNGNMGSTQQDGFSAAPPTSSLSSPTPHPMSPTQTQAKDSSETLLDQAKHAAQKMIGQTKDQLGTELKSQKDDASSKLGGVAAALRETGKTLGAGDDKDSALPGYANQAADQVERLSSYVRSRTIGDLIGDVEGFARREPAIFLGGSFALGLLAARFLKSTGHREIDPSERDTQPNSMTPGMRSGGSSLKDAMSRKPNGNRA